MLLAGQCTFWHFIAADIQYAQWLSCLLVHLHQLGHDMVNKFHCIGLGYINHIVRIVLCRLIYASIERAVSQHVTHCFLGGTHMTRHIYFWNHTDMSLTSIFQQLNIFLACDIAVGCGGCVRVPTATIHWQQTLAFIGGITAFRTNIGQLWQSWNLQSPCLIIGQVEV